MDTKLLLLALALVASAASAGCTERGADVPDPSVTDCTPNEEVSYREDIGNLLERLTRTWDFAHDSLDRWRDGDQSRNKTAGHMVAAHDEVWSIASEHRNLSTPHPDYDAFHEDATEVYELSAEAFEHMRAYLDGEDDDGQRMANETENRALDRKADAEAAFPDGGLCGNSRSG